MKFILNYRTVWLVFFGTDSSATMVPIGAIHWYRFLRYSGTDWSDTLVPISPLQWYRFADIISSKVNFVRIVILEVDEDI